MSLRSPLTLAAGASWAVLLALLSAAPLAAAQTRDVTRTSVRYSGTPFVALGGLLIGTETHRVRYDDSTRTTDLDNGYLVIELMDELAPHTLAGFMLGRVSPSPDARPALDGLNLSGSVLGFAFDGSYPLLAQRLQLLVLGGFQHVDSAASFQEQEADVEWNQVWARFGLGVRLNRFELRGGASYNEVRGEERVRGDVNASSDFESDEHYGSWLELDLSTDDRGHIGLLLESGGTERAHFYFRRFF